MKVEELEERNRLLQEKYQRMAEEIVDFEEVETADAEYLFVAYGISSRLCHSALHELRRKGIKGRDAPAENPLPLPRRQAAGTGRKDGKDSRG
jgi:pyruvate/2-oxoacid:ferredoxin oxidoreductase alpha subunit